MSVRYGRDEFEVIWCGAMKAQTLMGDYPRRADATVYAGLLDGYPTRRPPPALVRRCACGCGGVVTKGRATWLPNHWKGSNATRPPRRYRRRDEVI